jgi:translation elongation factor EF-1alpha
MAIHKIDGVDGVNHFPKKFVTLTAAGTITVGQIVRIDTGTTTNGAGMHVIANTTLDDPRVVGVAVEAASSGDEVKVQVAGMNADTIAGGAVNAGVIIGCSTGSAPAVLTAANITTRAFAICTKAFTTDPTVNYTDGEIMIFDHGFYG